MRQKNILLILSGGIAAYKALDLIRLLRKAGANVRCVMTENATRFVTPLSVAALSGHPAQSDMWESGGEIDHIRLSRESDLLVVAPATANIMAKMAHGLADDLASTLLLASDKPILVAPAMNVVMWKNPATQANVATLRTRGFLFVGPEKGAMACAEDGEGRMSEPTAIFTAIQNFFETQNAPKPLTGRKVLVTSGPTYEPLDPVRFIGNRSSGKQGHAIAEALAKAGADTILITGPTALPDPCGVHTIRIETALEMMEACKNHLPADIAICAAAVADWRPASVASSKIKKDKTPQNGNDNPKPHDQPLPLTLTENPDILAYLAQHETHRPKIVVGFAAETDNLESNARTKFKRKNCDMILANQVGQGQGFGTDENTIHLVTRDTQKDSIEIENWGQKSKTEIAAKLVTLLEEKLLKTAS